MKSRHPADAEYLFLSSVIASREDRLFDRAGLYKLCDTENYGEVCRAIAERFGVTGADGESPDGDALLSGALVGAYREMQELLERSFGDPSILEAMKCVYDGHNLKCAVKCEASGLSLDELLIDCGTVKASDVGAFVAERQFGAFPAHLAEVMPEAIRVYAETHQPQMMDILIDKAVFADKEELAEKSGMPYLSDLTAAKADLTDILVFARCVKKGRSSEFLASALVPGGKLPKELYFDSFEGGCEALFEKLAYTDYGALSAAYAEDGDLSHLERVCDELYAAVGAKAAFVPFGAEKAVYYLIEKENEIKNLRIILAGKKCGTPPAQLKEKLRGLGL